MTLNTLTIAEARDRLRARDISAVDLTEACLSAIDQAGALNAFVHHTPDLARTQAAAADACRLASGRPLTPPAKMPQSGGGTMSGSLTF